MITSSTSTTSAKEKAPRECLICGGSTRFAHMEIDACRACSVFYRRLCEKQKKPLTCRTGKFDCDTTKNGNFCCKRCRYDRFSADLNESRKRSDDESSVEEPSTSSSIQNVSAPIRSKPQPENSVIEGVRRGHSLMNAIRRTSELSTRTNNIPDDQGIFADGMMMIPTTYSPGDSPSENGALQHLLARNFFPFICVLDAEYRKMKHLPDQKSLFVLISQNQNNNIVAFKSLLQLLDLHRSLHCGTAPHRLSRGFEKSRRCAKARKIIHIAPSRSISETSAYQENHERRGINFEWLRFVSAFLDGDVQQNRTRMRRWNPAEEEYIALLGICFWSLDKINVSEQVHQIADNYRRKLFLELDELYRHKMGIGEFASRLGEAMLFVEAIQASFIEMRSTLSMLKLMDIIGEEYLLAELHL
ncbi:hypothetical protein PRIPAC_79321 [Pristionchus pacificus]|uniref:Nuclear receptor n=1 Tax=Pristionchus pacificus TaxID=54126 RepID=A0A2A6CLR6_PRIPA|nr:hypothetical protein PRIPAC_79321 [Pristionchus pacificus]|eukprot:PDM79017.1 nuclear receptor [Pristionchus pacificus]